VLATGECGENPRQRVANESRQIGGHGRVIHRSHNPRCRRRKRPCRGRGVWITEITEDRLVMHDIAGDQAR
jgi:hypothetical protein